MSIIANIFIKYWIEILFGLIISFLTYLYRSLANYKHMIISTRNGVRSLLKGEIIRKYYELKTRAEITVYEKQIVDELYEEYVNLGGNGVIKHLCDDIQSLPVKAIEND